MRRALPLALALLLAGCANAAADAGGAGARGRAALAAGAPRTARVEFMNAIQARPDDPALRILQARTLIALGEGSAAEAELRRAEALGVAPDRLAVLLADALLLQGRGEQAMAVIDGVPANGAAAIAVRARALAATGRPGDADALFAQAVAAAPDDPRIRLDLARFRRQIGDMAGAIAATDRALALAPRAARALAFRGELTRSQYGLAAALPWFDRAIAEDQRDPSLLLERAATHADLGDMAAMLADTRAALDIESPQPLAHHLQALMAARAGRWTLADRLRRQAGGALDDMPAAWLLDAAIDLGTGNAGDAARRLERLARAQPDNRKALRLLALARWRMGDAEATIEILRPLIDADDADSWSLALAARAFDKAGNARNAAYYRARAARAEGGAATMLLPAAGGDPRVAEIRSALTGGDGAGGVRLARALAERQAGSPDAHVLLGDALFLAGDYAGAAEAHRRAANLAFTEPVALRLIEALDRAGRPDAASRVIALFLQQNPRNVALRRLAAGRYVARGQWRPAIRLYEGLRASVGDGDALMLNNLAWAWAAEGDMGRALGLARRAYALDPGNAATADTLGWILLKGGSDRAQGLALLQRAHRG